MIKVSVIMLTYNREDLVSHMIECILGQSFHEFEFIIVDNGSTDRSGVIAEEYCRMDQRIRVIHRDRGNIGSGRNAGIDAAKGEYIAFVDDDDDCSTDFLEFLYKLVTESDSDISICGATWADIDEKKLMSPEEAIITLLWRKRYNVAFPTKMFKKTLFQQNRFLETGKYDDIYLMPKILSEAKRVAYHGISKYHFNRHESNNSAWTQNHKLLDAETLQEYLNVYEDRTKWLSKRYPDSITQWNYFNWSFMISMVEKVTRLELEECYGIRECLWKELNFRRKEIESCGYLLDFEKDFLDRYVININPEMNDKG